MENVYWIAGAAAVGAVAAPVGLSLLGFSAIGPVAGSVASWGNRWCWGVVLHGALRPFSRLL
jgi:hypothetical protein